MAIDFIKSRGGPIRRHRTTYIVRHSTTLCINTAVVRRKSSEYFLKTLQTPIFELQILKVLI